MLRPIALWGIDPYGAMGMFILLGLCYSEDNAKETVETREEMEKYP